MIYLNKEKEKIYDFQYDRDKDRTFLFKINKSTSKSTCSKFSFNPVSVYGRYFDTCFDLDARYQYFMTIRGQWFDLSYWSNSFVKLS